VCLAEQRLGHHRYAQAPLTCLDHRTQTRAAGTDHDNVVFVPLEFSHELLPSLREFCCRPAESADKSQV
jgi:hypothetical protein